jgi:hypothetical protein
MTESNAKRIQYIANEAKRNNFQLNNNADVSKEDKDREFALTERIISNLTTMDSNYNLLTKESIQKLQEDTLICIEQLKNDNTKNLFKVNITSELNSEQIQYIATKAKEENNKYNKENNVHQKIKERDFELTERIITNLTTIDSCYSKPSKAHLESLKRETLECIKDLNNSQTKKLFDTFVSEENLNKKIQQVEKKFNLNMQQKKPNILSKKLDNIKHKLSNLTTKKLKINSHKPDKQKKSMINKVKKVFGRG